MPLGERQRIRVFPQVRANRWEGENRARPDANRCLQTYGQHNGLPVLRFFAGPLAGMAHLPWPRFFVANAISGILWACSIGLLAYTTGQQGTTGLVVLATILGIGSFITHFAWRRLGASSG